MADLVVAATFLDRAEALIARGLLESEGLFAVVPEFDQLGVMPYLIHAEGGYRVLVRDADEAKAKAILAEIAKAAPLPDEGA
ncbi:MAG: DUF2007 domain-containing protein [Hyphomonadaceae bacterium]